MQQHITILHESLQYPLALVTQGIQRDASPVLQGDQGEHRLAIGGKGPEVPLFLAGWPLHPDDLSTHGSQEGSCIGASKPAGEVKNPYACQYLFQCSASLP